MRKLALLLALVLIPAQAWAFNTDTLLSTIAMPLAVAAVANVAGVPQTQLADLVTTLNQANVPPTQFVQVIRYVPVALVDQNGQPFIAYVQEQTTQGVTGDALVNAIVDRLRTNYNVTPVLDLNGEPTTVVVQDNYIPPVVLTRVTTLAPSGTLVDVNADPLAVIGLPLAVAAVSNITGVSQTELANLVATLNNANVPPVQVVEVLRYSPVALVADNGQPFVQFVQQQTSQGVTGPALVPVVVQQLQTFYPAPTQIVVSKPIRQRVFVERDFIPPVVITRTEEVRLHPHGGPPGQLKKQLGLQTGAEVVHGGKPGRKFVAAPTPVVTPTPVVVAPQAKPEKEHGRGHGKREEVRSPSPMISSTPTPAVVPAPGPPGKVKGNEGGGPPGQQKDKGNKGGKGHGKD